jgi:hypothetical protein
MRVLCRKHHVRFAFKQLCTGCGCTLRYKNAVRMALPLKIATTFLAEIVGGT